MLYLIDSSIYVFRAYYSLPDSMVDPEGNPVQAVYGFTRFLCEFIEQTKADYVGAAFDISLTSSFRNEIYPEYKANRDPAPEELKRQFVFCRRIADELGLSCFADSTCEADDIIGTLATKWRKKNGAITILSRDKDLLQLLDKDDVYWDFANDKTVAHNQVKEEFGVESERVADYLALTGDAVDNIKGVPGIGPKTAKSLLARYASLDEIYENLEDVKNINVRGAKTLKAKLVEHRDAAYLAQQLTQIKCDMDISAAKTNLKRRKPDLEALNKTFDELGFAATLRKKVEHLAKV